MKNLVFLILLLLGACLAKDTRVVTTTLGQIQGGDAEWPHDDSVTVYRGIPFGKPPVGPLRFASPQPVAPWTGIREAHDYAPDCWATNGGMSYSPAGMSEDCLYLNIFQPKGCSTSEKLPVLVYFYGGGWNMGSASFPVYNGANVIGSGSQRVVIATVSYRLASLGFLASEELRALNSDNSTGNMGLKDQRMATKFIKDNAVAFCGDPNSITVWGESAGAGSISNHLVMPKSEGMFNAAIIESGPIATWIADPMSGAQDQFNMVAKEVGCDPAKTPNVVACLQKVDTHSIVHASSRPPNTKRFTAYAPTIDGVEIPDAPYILAEQGKMHKNVAIMLGSNLNEGTLLVGGGGADLSINKSLTAQGYIEFAKGYFGNISSEVLALYPSSAYSSPWWAVTQIITDQAMACPARRMAKAAAAVGNPAFLYEFEHEVDVAEVDPSLGVFHGDDLVFSWFLRWYYVTWRDDIPPVYLPLTPDEHRLQQKVVDYWITFARTHNPNFKGQSTPVWPDAGPDGKVRLDVNLDLKVIPDWRPKFCDFWDKHPGFR